MNFKSKLLTVKVLVENFIWAIFLIGLPSITTIVLFVLVSDSIIAEFFLTLIYVFFSIVFYLALVKHANLNARSISIVASEGQSKFWKQFYRLFSIYSIHFLAFVLAVGTASSLFKILYYGEGWLFVDSTMEWAVVANTCFYALLLWCSLSFPQKKDNGETQKKTI